MGMNFRPPAASGGQTDVKSLYSYLFQLAEQLNVAFENVDAQGGGAAYKALQLAGGSTVKGEIDATTSEAYQNLKALIIKTATQVTSDIRKKYLDLAQSYIAQSEYGTYAEFLQAQIELGADGVVANWDQTNMITTSVADFNEYIAQSDVYMQIGIVRENQDGTVEAGVVVGKNFQKVTIDGVETITSKDVYMLLTAEQISFWQDGVKRSSFSLEDFFVNKAYIDEVQTSLISSKTFGKDLDMTGNSSIELLNNRLSLIVSSESSETTLVLTDTMLEAISEEVKLVAGTPDRLQNSSVTITPDKVQIETPVFSVQNESTGMTLDEEGLSAEHVSAPNLANKYMGKSNVYVGNTSYADYASLAELASDLNDRLLTQELTVTLITNVAGGAEFKNICGGKVRIECQQLEINGAIKIRNCNTEFEIVNATFTYTGYDNYCRCTNAYATFSSCVFNVSTASLMQPCLCVESGGKVLVINSEFYNTYGSLIMVRTMGQCYMDACSGKTDAAYAYIAGVGGKIVAYNGYPSGASIGTAASGGEVLLYGNEEQGVEPEPPAPITEATFTCSDSDTCRGSSNWDKSGFVWQGYTAGGVHRGYIWFDDLASAISGKTIASATLKITRVNGIGKSGATTLYAYYTTKSSASGTQSVSTAYGGEIGSIANGETKVFNLPVEILERIQAYGYGGIAFYSGESSFMGGRNYSKNYCKLYGAGSGYAPVLTVTYQ